MFVLAGCAGTPASKRSVAARDITPTQVMTAPDDYRFKSVEWGGIIQHAKNLRERTELEVVAYPLSGDGRPRTDERPLGRFIAARKGYLETADYAKGREVTVRGIVEGIRGGKVGEADYRFPVVAADELKLWPRRAERSGGMVIPRIHFGIGIGSGGRSSVGIGVGF